MKIRYIVSVFLFLWIGLPSMAQVDDDRSYKGIRIDGKSDGGEIITVNVLPLGNGILYFRDGGRTPLDGTYRLIVHENMYYIGTISKGLANGDWEHHSYGRLYEKGTYKKGVAHGVFKQYDSSGYTANFTFHEGKPKHYIAHYTANNRLRQERFYDENGELHGKVTTYDENGGIIAESNYENGYKQGVGMHKNRNGHTIICEYQYDRKIGSYAELYPNGNVVEKGTYSAGEKKEGLWVWGEENGDIKMEAHYEGGQLNGIKREYYKGNKLKSEEGYANGKLSGPVLYYDEAPYLKTSEGTFLDGDRHGVFKVYHDGILWRETIYQNDRLVGKKEYAEGKLQIIQLVDETGAMVDVGKYDKSGKRVYRNQNYRTPTTLRLKEDAYGIIDVEF